MIFFCVLYYIFLVLLRNNKIRINILNILYIEKNIICGASFGNNLRFIFLHARNRAINFGKMKRIKTITLNINNISLF